MLNALSTSPVFAAVFLIGNLVAAILLLAQATGAGVSRRALAAGLVVAVAWVGLCVGFRASIPASLVTVLQEGFAGDVLTRLAGQGLHGLPGQAVVVRALTGGGDVRDVVAVDLALTGLLALLLLAVIVRLGGNVLVAVVLVAGWLIAPVTRSTALSTEAAPLAALYTVVAVLPVTGRWGLPGAARVGLIALLAALAALVRQELGVMLAGSAVVVALGELAPESTSAAEAWWRGVFDRAISGGRALGVLAVVVAWVLVAIRLERWTSSTLPHGHLLAVTVRAIHPLNVAWVTAFPMLVATLPIGLVVLGLLGWARALRSPLRTGGIALSLPVVWQAWHGAAHGWVYRPDGMLSVTELFRYLAQATPVWVLLATVGLLTATRWNAAFAWVLWVLCLVPPIPSAAQVVSHHRPGDDPRVAALPGLGLVDGDLQREVRATIAARDTNPGCALRTRGRRWGSSPASPVVEDVQLEAGERGPILSRAAPGRLSPARAACTLVLVPLDCGLARHQVDCAGLVPGDATRVASFRFEAAPWVFADHTGGWEGSTQSFEIWREPPALAGVTP